MNWRINMDVRIKQDLPTLSKNMKRLRLSHGMTQEQIVAKMQLEGSNISRSTYAKIEVGLSSIWLSDLKRLSKIYKVSLDELLS